VLRRAEAQRVETWREAAWGAGLGEFFCGRFAKNGGFVVAGTRSEAEKGVVVSYAVVGGVHTQGSHL
jgi:hypothetical protein